MKRNIFYGLVWACGRIAFGRSKTVWEAPPADDEPAVFVCNHAGIRGPAIMTLDFKRRHKTWTICYTLSRSTCPNFAFHDFFAGESRKHKKAWRALSRAVGIAMPHLFSVGDVIPLYHDERLVSTLRDSLDTLKSGEDIVIFAESPVRFSEYVNELQCGFADLGYLYHLKTGKNLKFYPVYAEKKNRAIAIGAPIGYDPAIPARIQREQISAYVRDGIDRMGRSLKKHKPVPFLPQRWYDHYGQYEHDLQSYWKLFEIPEDK